MKKIKLFTLLFFLSSLIFYIAGCVSSASFSIKEWDDFTRGSVSTFWVAAFVPISSAVSEVKE